jgi:hypothetical protein
MKQLITIFAILLPAMALHAAELPPFIVPGHEAEMAALEVQSEGGYRAYHAKPRRSINADSRDWPVWRCRIYDEIVRVKDQHPEPFRILAEMDPSKLGGQPPVFELYDLQNDPHELRNPAHRPQLQRLHTALQSWHAATKDSDFEMPALPAAKPGNP